MALSRGVEHRAKAVIAQRLNVNTAGIVDLIVWGNVNGKHFIDNSKVRKTSRAFMYCQSTIIIMNVIYIVQFDTYLTALYIVKDNTPEHVECNIARAHACTHTHTHTDTQTHTHSHMTHAFMHA